MLQILQGLQTNDPQLLETAFHEIDIRFTSERIPEEDVDFLVRTREILKKLKNNKGANLRI